MMQFTEIGTEKDSHIYFYTSNQASKSVLYYPIVAGSFNCNAEYSVERESYDSILLLCVLEGSVTLIQNGSYTANKNEMLIVNCYEAHKYFANGYARTVWLHFDGKYAKEWFSEIGSQKMKRGGKIADEIFNIIEKIKQHDSIYTISSAVYSIMCEILNPVISIENEQLEKINEAKKFIEENFQEPLSVEKIAATINYSVSYFTKIFKDATKLSPYDYLLSLRLEKAKELLHKSEAPISQVAFLTGFNSVSNFIYFFKKHVGVSPLKFRNIIF